MGRLDIFKMADMIKDPPVEAALEAEVIQESSFEEPQVEQEPEGFSKADIKEALPAQLRTKVTDSLMARLNGISTDPDLAQEIKDNFIGFNSVMKEGKFKFEDYLNACAYVTYKMMGHTNQSAWGLTFPEKLAKMRAENRADNYIGAFVAGYSKGKLVNMLLEQALIPSFLLNQDLHQKALNVCADLMVNGKSEKTQVDAARAVLEATRAPEKSKVELDVTVKDNSGIGELKSIMKEVAKNQVAQIESGKPTQEIAHESLFEKDA